MAYTLAQIAHIETDFSEKFGIPRQSGLVEELRARIVFEPEFRSPDAVRGLDGYDYIWLVWQFSTVVGRMAPTGAPPCARRGWAAIPAWGCLPPAARSGPMRWGFPA